MSEIDKVLAWAKEEIQLHHIDKATTLHKIAERMMIRECWYMKIDYGRICYDAITPKVTPQTPPMGT